MHIQYIYDAERTHIVEVTTKRNKLLAFLEINFTDTDIDLFPLFLQLIIEHVKYDFCILLSTYSVTLTF